MALHFSSEEFADRQARAVRALADHDLDALLMFAQESHFWISGYDTFGFAMFQCMVLTRAGELHPLTRMPDLRQAQQTSVLPHDHIHIWEETFDSSPAVDLARLLAMLGVAGRIGFENATVVLTDANGQSVRAAIDGLVETPHLGRTEHFAEVRFAQPQAEGSVIPATIRSHSGAQLVA